MSEGNGFVDYYEVLQLSPTADKDMVERVYRLLAKRFHPDNEASGDEQRFREIHEAYVVLSDPEKRAEFDVRYDEQKSVRWTIFDQGTATDRQAQDRRIFHGILSLLYAARRRKPEDGGLGTIDLEQMLGVPREHMEFPIWYLRRKGLIEVLQTGELAITIDGIDAVNEQEMAMPANRLLNGTTPDVPVEPMDGPVDPTTLRRRAEDRMEDAGLDSPPPSGAGPQGKSPEASSDGAPQAESATWMDGLS